MRGMMTMRDEREERDDYDARRWGPVWRRGRDRTHWCDSGDGVIYAHPLDG